MSRNTYVWVGLATVANEEGNLETCVGIMMSKDGTSTSTPANLTAVSKLTAIEHVALANASDLPASLQAKLPSDVATENATNKFVLNLNNSLATLDFKKPNMPGGKISFGSGTYNDTILISPQGEIISSATSQSFVPQIMIGLTQSRKGTSLKDQAKDGAVLVFYGGTGQVRVYRL